MNDEMQLEENTVFLCSQAFFGVGDWGIHFQAVFGNFG